MIYLGFPKVYSQEKIEPKRFIKAEVYKISPGCEDGDIDNQMINKYFKDLIDQSFLHCRLKKDDGHIVVD